MDRQHCWMAAGLLRAACMLLPPRDLARVPEHIYAPQSWGVGCPAAAKKDLYAFNRGWMLLTALLLHHLDCRRPAPLPLLPTFAR